MHGERQKNLGYKCLHPNSTKIVPATSCSSNDPIHFLSQIFFFWGIFLIFMYAYITGFVVCVSKLLRQMEIGFVKLCLLPCWVLYFLLTFYLSNYCLDETCYFHIWLYTLVFFFWFAVVFLLLLFDTGMVLKRDWTGRSDRFNWEPAFNLVQLWAKTKNDLKTKEIRKPGSSTGESGTGMVEPVNDRLGFFFYFS